jgi:hypothetical protein
MKENGKKEICVFSSCEKTMTWAWGKTILFPVFLWVSTGSQAYSIFSEVPRHIKYSRAVWMFGV